jgi:hypothetical protein
MRPSLGANGREFNLQTVGSNSFCRTSAKEQAQAVHDHNDRAAFMANHTNGERNFAEQGEGHQDDYGPQRNEKVLADDRPGPLTETKRGEKVFQAIMHEHYIGLFERGIGAAGSHGHTDVRGGQAGGIVDTITDHGDAFAAFRERSDFRELLLRLEFGADVVEGQFITQVLGGGPAVAGQDHGAETFAPQLLKNGSRLGADIIAQDETPQQTIARHPDFRQAGIGWGHARYEFGAFALGQPLPPAKLASLAVQSSD